MLITPPQTKYEYVQSKYTSNGIRSKILISSRLDNLAMIFLTLGTKVPLNHPRLCGYVNGMCIRVSLMCTIRTENACCSGYNRWSDIVPEVQF